MDIETKKMFLKNHIGGLKGRITYFKNDLERKGDEISIGELQSILNRLQPLYDKYDDAYTELSTLAPDLISEAERNKFDNEFGILESKIITLLDEKKVEVVREKDNIKINGESANVKIKVPLPEIKLPIFDGSFTSWINFRDVFKELIHENKNISPVLKFHYLHSSLRDGSAFQYIEHLPPTADNYASAWKELFENFENESRIKRKHVKELYDIKKVQENSATSLQKFIDTIHKHVFALKALDVKIEEWDLLLLHHLMERLDSESHRKIEQSASINKLLTLQNFIDILRQRVHILETCSKPRSATSDSYKPNTSKNSYYSNRNASTLFSTNQSCPCCHDQHTIFKCKKFLNLSIEERNTFSQTNKLCKNCLSNAHQIEFCKYGRCRVCHRKHHTLLHYYNSNHSQSFKNPETSSSTLPSSNGQPNKQAESERVDLHSATNVSQRNKTSNVKQVLLATAVVNVRSSNGMKYPCRALLDTGSQSNLLTESLCQKLNLPRENVSIPISGINQALTHINHATKITVESRYSNFELSLNCFVIPKITGHLPFHTIEVDRSKIPTTFELADPEFFLAQKIDLLIGAEYYTELITGRKLKLIQELPVFQETTLGWILMGSISTTVNHVFISSSAHCLENYSIDKLHYQIQKFWSIEEIDHPNNLSLEEKACEEYYKRTVKRDSTGRYTVSLPTKRNLSDLGESKQMAYRQFLNLEDRLSKTPEIREMYNHFMTEYADMGHMQSTNESDINSTTTSYFMPHHGVHRPSSTTTKLRVVFNGSQRTSSGLSLNDVLMVGPTIQQDLLSIILRFRKHNVALTADIAKMYRQINISEEDRHLQKIWWRDLRSHQIQVFQLHTVTYGTACAPFLAIRTLHQLASDEIDKYPVASKILITDFYVDDLVSGAQTIEEAKFIQSQLNELLLKGGFELRKWCSNSKIVVPNNKSSQELISTLGVTWDSNQDNFIISFGKLKFNSILTKRSILSEIAQLFDPLGLCSPVIFTAKHIMQRLWSIPELSWNDEVPEPIYSTWMTFRDELTTCAIEIPRCIISGSAVKSVELHGFGDASERGYGCCIYIRTTDRNNVHTSRLLCGKSKVAPLKRMTIPRLELCASLLLAQLYNKVKDAMEINFNRVTLWSDSEVTLYRIKSSPSRYSTFVSHRISQIQDLTPPDVWSYVPTESNPADLVSRGIMPSLLKSSALWWNGPDFLVFDPDKWPEQSKLSSVSDDIEYRKTEKPSLSAIIQENYLIANYSDYSKLLRISALCMRFTNNVKLPKDKRITGPLTMHEIDQALLALVKYVQIQHYKLEIKNLLSNHIINSHSGIKNLNPFIDDSGLLRVGGRLQNSNLEYNRKHPILLPGNDALAERIVRGEHHRSLHAGPQALLNIIRQRFWVTNGRNLCRRIVFQCIRCFRTKPTGIEQLMGDLPATRVQPSRPFTHVGIDYGGPFHVSYKFRSNTTTKAYLALFVCFVTKACHLEIVQDLSTTSFISALRRFISRRGRCTNLYSDNATNFVGAKSELNDLKRLFDTELHQHQLFKFCTDEGIRWQTIPPRSPHFGGLWEAAIKSAKYHIKRIIGNSKFTLEDLNTFVIQVEACLNSRPLTRMSEDPSDMAALTPAHFLIGGPITALPEPSLFHLNFNRLSHWQKIQHSMQQFWQRWSTEYLNELQQRQKWQTPQANIKIGSLVLLKEDNIPPIRWIMGRIVASYPGSDGFARVVSVKTQNGEFKRAVTRICPLPMESKGDN